MTEAVLRRAILLAWLDAEIAALQDDFTGALQAIARLARPVNAFIDGHRIAGHPERLRLLALAGRVMNGAGDLSKVQRPA